MSALTDVTTVEPVPPTEDGPTLRCEQLRTTFSSRGLEVDAVRGVDLELRAGEITVLLGESGSGKSVTARSIMRLHGGNAKVTGSVELLGEELLDLTPGQMLDVRGSRIAMVPQDPTAALDPLRRVGAQIVEVLRRHDQVESRRAARERAIELLDMVGIPDPSRVAKSFPHELSGGMRQRVVIAIAISCGPEVLIADEPTTALDVTVQAQILALFRQLAEELGSAVLLVTHDVGVAAEVGDRVGVMYAGLLVEFGPATEVLDDPHHPYTAALLDSIPVPGTPRGELQPILGQPPVSGEIPAGCAFAPRCRHALPECSGSVPDLVATGSDRLAACPVTAGALIAAEEVS